MTVLDIFSKRHTKPPEVFSYDVMPPKLRVQLVHVVQDLVGDRLEHVLGTDYWALIAKGIAAEHGLLRLPSAGHSAGTDCLNYILTAEPPQVMDLLEVVFRLVRRKAAGDGYFAHNVASVQAVDKAVKELNHRFLENAFGYQFESEEFIRVDSLLIHEEAVKPALRLLTNGFDGANSEFLAAYDHFRNGRIEPALAESLKAFESTLKQICDERNWAYDPAKATAAALIKVVLDKGLVPKYSDEQLRAVEKCLIGIATLRNKNSGHGAGAKSRNVPEFYAAYAIHLAATNIVFLVEAHRALK